MSFSFNDLPVGTELPELELPPLSEADLARYAAASGDHNPLHTNPAFAQAAGLDGVIAHGMLVMGLLGRLLGATFGTAGLRRYSARFRDKTRPGEPLRCGGRVVAAEPGPNGGLIVAEVWVRDNAGSLKLSGTVEAELPR